MIRRLASFALLGALACSRAASAPATPTPAQARAGAAPRAAQDTGRAATQGPKPYAQVITRDAVTDSGVFIVHRIGEKLFYEIPRAMLDREFTLIADQRGTQRGVGYAGEEVNDWVIRWERVGSKVLARLVSYAMVADSTLPVSRAVRLSNQAPIIMAFDIAAWSPGDSNAVVEVTRLYTTDVGELNIRRDIRARRLDPARTVIERARAFPRNVEVSVLQTFEVDSLRAPGVRGLNTVTLLMNYSMVLLPDQPMQPRLCDARVGFFSVRQEDFGRPGAKVPTRCYITRWRLEPKDPAAAVSDAVTPIVFYLDPATPEQWVPWLIKGVGMWEPVFRAAGLSNAIMARRAPSPEEDPEFDVDDARYSTIRWLPSTIENAYGPHVSDPRTGEILQSNIGWYHNITSLLQSWYWVQVGAVDPRARTLPFPDSLMGEMVAYVAAHEVGHTLGLPHNQLSSGYYPVDSLRSPTYTRRHGTSYSIMDYARNNYVAQPGDDVQLMPTIGVWDYYVINWGYRRFPGLTDPDVERPVLDSLARLQDTHPEYRFGNMDGIDPRAQRETLGDDPVAATRYGIANIKRLVPMLLAATTTTKPLEDYSLLDDMYGDLIAQWGREMDGVAVVVGGVYRHEKYPTQEGVIHTPVPRAKQAAAVRFLNENAFATPSYFFDADVLRRVEPTGHVERVRARQSVLLRALFQDARLSRLAEQQATLPAGAAYTLVDLFRDVRRGLFSEYGAAAPVVDPYRRNLQVAFVEEMDRLLNTSVEPPRSPFAGFPGFTPPPPRPTDAQAVARLELEELAAALRAARAKVADRATQAHVRQLGARIEQVLNPNR